MKFYIADAFTETLFGGNPAGVVILSDGAGYPTEETMVKTAAELRYSETAFIRQLSDAAFELRYFTPAAEVDLCGHATIGAFSALLADGRISANGLYRCHTKAGELEIRIQDGRVMMEMATPQLIGKIDDAAEIDRLYEIMGLEYTRITTARPDGGGALELLPLIISTGLPDILLPVADRRELADIAPDFALLTKLSKEYAVTGVHAFTLDAPEGFTACCRNFAPLYDIDEEAATGTANGALTYYLYGYDLITAGQDCTFLQGEAMGRPSTIRSRLSREPLAVRVGGSAVLLAAGEIFL